MSIEHVEHERAALAQPHHREHTCYICHEPAHGRCERCNHPICKEHTTEHPGMHWETWRTTPGYAGGWTWTRYVLDGLMVPVCPQCLAGLLAEQAHEIQHDRELVRHTILWRLAGLVVGLMCAIGFYLGVYLGG